MRSGLNLTPSPTEQRPVTVVDLLEALDKKIPEVETSWSSSNMKNFVFISSNALFKLSKIYMVLQLLNQSSLGSICRDFHKPVRTDMYMYSDNYKAEN